MHSYWDKNLLGLEINMDLGYPSVEIDESKIISSGYEIYWMFSIIDRNTKEARAICVLTSRTKERLLPLVNKYVANNYGLEEDDERESIRARIFFDCFRSYVPSDFEKMGFFLKRINHSVWFVVGILHTNTIESLLHQIKMITNNFSGLSIEKL